MKATVRKLKFSAQDGRLWKNTAAKNASQETAVKRLGAGSKTLSKEEILLDLEIRSRKRFA
jgi:hypothetical protein